MDNNDQITNQKIQSQQRASFRPKIELKENKDYFCHYSSMDMNIRNFANNWQSSFWHLASISLSIMVERLHATDRTEGNVIHGIDKVCFIYPLDNTVHERYHVKIVSICRAVSHEIATDALLKGIAKSLKQRTNHSTKIKTLCNQGLRIHPLYHLIFVTVALALPTWLEFAIYHAKLLFSAEYGKDSQNIQQSHSWSEYH